MRKWLLAFAALILSLCLSHMAFAAEHSADTMILYWRTEKVWMEHGELCVRGTFYNRRSDLTVTKLDEMILQITFTGTDGKTFQFIGHPKRLPMLKLPANGSKKSLLISGPFQGNGKTGPRKKIIHSVILMVQDGKAQRREYS